MLGIEQFETGHVRGGSQDHSRIIRLSYHTPGYVDLAKQAYAAWAALEVDTGTSLILRTGGLDLFPAGGVIPMADYKDSMDAAGVAYETLDAAETMRRWPQFTLSEDVVTLYQSESGIAPAARCNAAHLQGAVRHGAQILENAPVTGIRTRGPEIQVDAGGITHACRRLVIAAGAWTNHMLGFFDLELPLEITREQVIYYHSRNPADYAPDRFPVWIWMDEPCFYGFPVYGEAGPKVAQDVGGRVVTAETRNFEPDPENTARIERFLAAHLPGIPGPQIYTKTCLYTLTPDRDFVLDHLPGQPNIWVAVGAGHAFKFASVLGKILSEGALDGEMGTRLDAFRIDRPILLEEDPVRSYMI